MPIVPIGLQFDTWRKGTPNNSSKPKKEAVASVSKGSDTAGGFTPVITTNISQSKFKSRVKSKGRKNTNLISPLEPIIEQTKDRQNKQRAPDDASLSLNLVRVSSGVGSKKKSTTKSAQSGSGKSYISKLKEKSKSQKKKK